ncbi:hypothetical protein ACHAWF_017314 [Thalassiosira exigua]
MATAMDAGCFVNRKERSVSKQSSSCTLHLVSTYKSAIPNLLLLFRPAFADGVYYSTAFRRMMMSSDDVIYVDDDTPFYTKQPTAELNQIFQTESKRIASALGGHVTSDPLHIGSTAIKGLPGTPVVDIAFSIREFPANDDVVSKLSKIGYDYKGPSPHDDKNDCWAMGGNAKKGHLGRVIVHMSRDGSDFCENAAAFRDYCNAHPEAFKAYKNVKLQGAELARENANNGGMSPHFAYKMHKNKIQRDIVAKSLAWNNNHKQGN